jgi:hypothetical protein
MCTEKDELAVAMRGSQHLDDETAEQARENPHGQEEIRPAGDPSCSVGG